MISSIASWRICKRLHSLELADIFTLYGPAYCNKYNDKLLPSHRRAIRDISACRTPALGGQLYRCHPCDETRYSYHSCKNRHCPKCGNDAATAWLQKQFDKLLPVTHFLVTFTLPGRLRVLARTNQKALYRILMESAAAALLKLTSDPKWIGGIPGVVSLLQTWTRDLRYHPHVHMIVSGGGLSPDGSTWFSSPHNFLLPAPALSIIFRAKFRHALKRQGLLAAAPAAVWKQRWVVDIRSVGSGHSAFRYLAPYLFRVALSNNRLVSLKNDHITFRYQHSKTSKTLYCTLPAQDFLHRFLQHVLPLRFRRLRYYGLFSPHQKKLLASAKSILQPLTSTHLPHSSLPRLAPSTPPLCPRCAKPMTLVQTLSPWPRLTNTIRSP